jgi:hypothetical protein
MGLHFIRLQKRIKAVVMIDEENYELAKSKVFTAAISMISEDSFDIDETVVKTILPNFLNENRICDKQSWLPQQFTIALAVRNRIDHNDLRIMLTVDPLAIDRLNKKEGDVDEIKDKDEDNQKADLLVYTPNLSYPKASVLRDHYGRCALHLVAQYSENFELFQDILQMDQNMINMLTILNYKPFGNHSPLGLLCSRLHFPTFDKMLLSLIKVDSTVKIIADGMVGCLRSYEKKISRVYRPREMLQKGLQVVTGDRDERSLILIRTLLSANPAVVEYDNSQIFHMVCSHLKGELCTSVLSLFLKEDSNAVKTFRNGDLPIHVAAFNSTSDVVTLLHNAYPESISLLDSNQRSLLHAAVTNQTLDVNRDIVDVIAMVRYLYGQFPPLIHLKDYRGETPLHNAICIGEGFSFECVKTLCDLDATVVRDKCTFQPLRIRGTLHIGNSGRLPLHCLFERRDQILEISDRGDCFRLLLRLYPAAAGIEDVNSESPYDMAMSNDDGRLPFSTYFIRLLLAADPTIDPVRRHDLNFEARRQGMFLAFKALSSDIEPTIWAKIRLKGRDFLEHVISYL